jgi:hypothetical protein
VGLTGHQLAGVSSSKSLYNDLASNGKGILIPDLLVWEAISMYVACTGRQGSVAERRGPQFIHWGVYKNWIEFLNELWLDASERVKKLTSGVMPIPRLPSKKLDVKWACTPNGHNWGMVSHSSYIQV